MMSDLYENLLKATDNTNDITVEKYGVITKLDGLYCSVKETDNELEHSNVPILNGANLSVGDKAIIGFLNNSIYDVVCYGALDKTVHDDSKQDTLISGTNIKTINHQSLLGSGNIDIQGGGSDVDIVTSWEPTPSDTKVPSEKLTKDTLDAKADASSLATVATTGDYDDLTDKPSIPSSSSDLSDGSNIVKKSSTSGLLKNDGSVDTNAYITSSAITGKEDTSNKVTSWSSTVNDTHYPSEKLVSDSLATKQATLVSGTNIKTINNQSLLGSGNITIQGGGSVTVDSALSTTSENPVQNKVITGALNGKADSSSLSTVATSGSYTDLSNKPTIPTKISDLTNDSDFIEKSNTSGLLKNDGSVDTTQYLSSLPSHNHDDRYYTETEIDNLITYTQIWANQTSNPTIILQKNGLGMARLIINGYTSSTLSTSWVQYGSSAFMSSVKPKMPVYARDTQGTIGYRVDDAGRLYWKSESGSSQSNRTHYAQIDWSIA